MWGHKGKEKKLCLYLLKEKQEKEIIEIVKNHTASEVIKTLNKFERKLGEKKFRKTFKSITVDNGTEFSDWEKWRKADETKRCQEQKYIIAMHTKVAREQPTKIITG